MGKKINKKSGILILADNEEYGHKGKIGKVIYQIHHTFLA
jgi:hypothetical protein